MANNTNTMSTGWLAFFKQERKPAHFLQSFFTVKRGGVYYGNTIEVDIKRFNEAVAIVVKRGTGANLNDADQITTKEFEPPAYGEAFPTDVSDLLERTLGVDPYTDSEMEYTSKLLGRLMDYFMRGYEMIVRGIELQASQILQTGRLSLVDSDGNERFEADFRPKANHFPTVTTAWGADGYNPIEDLRPLIERIRGDALLNPDMLIFGERAIGHFITNDTVRGFLDDRRVNIAEIRPRQNETGGTFYGYVWIGAYLLEMWTYSEGYTDPENETFTKYVQDDKVIVMASRGRLDRLSAKVALPLGPDPRVAALMPGRLVEATEDIDITPNLYPTPDGRQIMAEVLSRTLLAPIDIDSFGCLDTQP
ncbi:major capsid E family protein [Vibrio phage CKB-S1]|nr:major capsid E family protein [Vibrio phage CKB-S1]